MGGRYFNAEAYNRLAATAKETENSGFPKQACAEFNPTTVTTRFSKKGPFNEFRDVLTILIGLDVTGSMDRVSKNLVKGQLGSLMVNLKKIFNRPNENLQLSFAGIGDAKTDKAPLQVTHFESDNRIAEQLNKIYLEGAGGGNGAESYNLLWWYAANKTKLPYIEQDKNKRKGILITVGDDNVHPNLTAHEIRKILDPKYKGRDVTNKELIEAAGKQYEIYHIVLIDGDAYNFGVSPTGSFEKSAEDKSREEKQWKDLLGEKNVVHSKIDAVHDAIASIIARHRPEQTAEMSNLSQEEWSRKNRENLTDEQWIEVLSYTLCPLTQVYMDDPVECGGVKRAYQRQAIEDHIRKLQQHPMTKKTATLESLQSNSRIADLCSDYRSYFEELPEPRKLHLIKLAIEKVKAIDTSASSNEYYNVEVARNTVSSSAAASSSAPPAKVISVSSSGSDDVKRAAPASAAPAKNIGLFSHKPAAVVSPVSGVSVLNLDSDGIPFIYKCPISLEVMKNPVMAMDGRRYERAEIEKVFAGKPTAISPVTQEEIGSILIPDSELKGEIMRWKEELAKKAAESSSTSAPSSISSGPGK